MRRFLPCALFLLLPGCVLPDWPPPWVAGDDDVSDDDQTVDDTDVSDDDADDDSLTTAPLDWVHIAGDTFEMGYEHGDPDELPVHDVQVPDFEILRTEVTVAQYAACLDAGTCTEPVGEGEGCVDVMAGAAQLPVGCVDWDQAHGFCAWADARLPSEAEWEFAARNLGEDVAYPWGNETATCVYAIMHDDDFGGTGCGTGGLWVVCSRSATGNTDQDLCDMAGNAAEWVQDWYHATYHGAPEDGSAWEAGRGTDRVSRGGSCSNDADRLRAAYRAASPPDTSLGGLGFRCARDVP